MRRGRHLGVLTVVLAACANTSDLSTVPPTVAATTVLPSPVIVVEPVVTASPAVAAGEIPSSTTTFAGLLEDAGVVTEAIRPADVTAPATSPPPPEEAPVEEEPESVPDLIRRMVAEAFGSQRMGNEGVSVARCESIDFNPAVIYGPRVGPYGEIGVWQIYVLRKNGTPGPQYDRVTRLGFTPEDMFDPEKATVVAIDLRREIGHWGYPAGWSCAARVGLR